MFKVTGGKGVHIKFDNEYAVSIQWGFGNYCENRNSLAEMPKNFDATQRELGENGSVDAECAVFDPEGKMLDNVPDWSDTVNGWMSPDAVLKLMNWVAEL